MMDSNNTSSLEFVKSYPLCPFSVTKNNIIFIPEKYLDVLHSMEPEVSQRNFTNLQATEENWQMIRELLVTGYWMDCWYPESKEEQMILPTPQSFFISLNDGVNTEYRWDTPKFIRLNSLSSKNQQQPLYTLNEQIKQQILTTSRCQRSLEMAKRTNREISFVVRDWIEKESGSEWRCFIYEDNLKAICSNDSSCVDIPDNIIISRAQQILSRVKFHLPCVDCVMDIWLTDNLFYSDSDLLIEFNSYGFWGNSDSGLFDWVEDGYVLYNSTSSTTIRRNVSY